jgi:divalent metal cation (Fe/Co/Zn/Cd) transporter
MQVTTVKFGAFLATGSASMLSETVHSLGDSLNQVLLAIGIRVR